VTTSEYAAGSLKLGARSERTHNVGPIRPDEASRKYSFAKFPAAMFGLIALKLDQDRPPGVTDDSGVGRRSVGSGVVSACLLRLH